MDWLPMFALAGSTVCLLFLHQAESRRRSARHKIESATGEDRAKVLQTIPRSFFNAGKEPPHGFNPEGAIETLRAAEQKFALWLRAAYGLFGVSLTLILAKDFFSGRRDFLSFIESLSTLTLMVVAGMALFVMFKQRTLSERIDDAAALAFQTPTASAGYSGLNTASSGSKKNEDVVSSQERSTDRLDAGRLFDLYRKQIEQYQAQTRVRASVSFLLERSAKGSHL